MVDSDLAREDGEEAGGEAAGGHTLTLQGLGETLPVPEDLRAGGPALAGAGEVHCHPLCGHRGSWGDHWGSRFHKHCDGDLKF